MLLIAAIALGAIASPLVSASDIEPLTGNWEGRLTVRSLQDCSFIVRREIEKRAADPVQYSKALVFRPPFNLNRLNAEWGYNIAWQRVASNRWEGELAHSEATAFGLVKTNTVIKTRVTSDQRIDQTAITTISLPPLLSKRVGAAKPCVVTSDIKHRRKGP